MKKIKLTFGKFAIVDDDDYDLASKIDWRYSKNGYASKSYRKNGKVKTIYLHRLINKTPNGIGTDHINRNRLDNRKINLRTANQDLNNFNKGIMKNNTSGKTGVTWHSQVKKWWARINFKGKTISLGCFIDFSEAVFVREKAEIYYYGK